jgi:uncharacterized membrane protein SirB2
MVEWYLPILATHVSCAIISLSFFIVRGIWMILDNAMLQRPLIRVLPHVIDTMLLVSAVSLTLILEQYPFINGWLTAKLCALILYIILGTIALKRGRTKFIRIGAFGASIFVFAIIVGVALSHDQVAVKLLLAWSCPDFLDCRG